MNNGSQKKRNHSHDTTSKCVCHLSPISGYKLAFVTPARLRNIPSIIAFSFPQVFPQKEEDGHSRRRHEVYTRQGNSRITRQRMFHFDQNDSHQMSDSNNFARKATDRSTKQWSKQRKEGMTLQKINRSKAITIEFWTELQELKSPSVHFLFNQRQQQTRLMCLMISLCNENLLTTQTTFVIFILLDVLKST